MNKSKLDPRLQVLLSDWQAENPPRRAARARPPLQPMAARFRGVRPAVARRVAGRAPSQPPTAQPAARVFLECRRSATPNLAGTGASVSPAGDWLRTATVPIDQIARVAAHRDVRRATLARRLRPLLDKALPRIHVPQFRSNTGSTGASVVVGIIDTGADARHPAFNGRILCVWDQTRRGAGVLEGNYGIELTGAAVARSRDTDGHGTHVAGIAAGNHPAFGGGAWRLDRGRQDDDGRYRCRRRDSLRVSNREARGAAAVVNLSLGDHDDGHDGSDALSRVIDQASGPGRIVCCAAGNEGDDNIHGVARVTRAGDAGMRFHVPGRSVGEASLTGGYPPGSALEVAVRTPKGKLTPFQRIIAGGASAARKYRLSVTDITVTTPGPDPANGDHNFRVTLRSASRGARVRGGVWQLCLRLVSGPPATVHVWTLDDADYPEVVFTGKSRSDTMKVGSPGSAGRAITVASFTTRNRWTALDGDDYELGYALGKLTSFSSEGPLRNRARKPDVTAPGAGIGSALSRHSEPDPEDILANDIVLSSGTSMACPFVAGLVALLLDQEPQLTPEQVKRRLRKASRIPGRGAGAFDIKWGYGLVDASRLLP